MAKKGKIKTTPASTADARRTGIAAGNKKLKKQVQAQRYGQAAAQGQGEQWLKAHPKAAAAMGNPRNQAGKKGQGNLTQGANNQNAGQIAKAENQIVKQQAATATNAINPSVYATATGTQTVQLDANGRPIVVQKETAPQQNIRETGEKLTQAGQAQAQKLLGGYQQFDAGPDTKAFKGNVWDSQYEGGRGAGAAGNKLIGGYQKFNQTGSPEERARIEEAVYGKLTRNIERDRQREFDEMEQRMYNRGIPLDPSNPAYKREMDALNEKYNTAKENAMQTATQMGGQELERTFGMGLQSHQQGVSDISSLTGIAEDAYKTRQGANQQQFSQQLSGNQQNLAIDQQNYAQNLGEHQQGMADMSGLQSQGFGYQKADLPGFQAPTIQQTSAGQIGTAISGQQTQKDIAELQAETALKTAAMAAEAGGSEEEEGLPME